MTPPIKPELSAQVPAPAAPAQILTTAPRQSEEISAVERRAWSQMMFLKQFGYSFFYQPPASFLPVTAVPVGPDYVIGPGDTVRIVIWGSIQAEYSLTVDRNGQIDIPRVGVVHVSNVLGTLNPVKEIIARAHARGVPVLVDGAQAVPHLKVDVQDLDADFYVFSGHKLSGPTGIGVLYGKLAHLEAMPPWHGGGSMIRSVSWEKTTYLPAPGKFEAGTPPIAAAIGLGAAIDYVTALGLDRIAAHEHELLAYASERLAAIPGLRILGTARNKASVLSFVVEGIHPHDMGSLLDGERLLNIVRGHRSVKAISVNDLPSLEKIEEAIATT